MRLEGDKEKARYMLCQPPPHLYLHLSVGVSCSDWVSYVPLVPTISLCSQERFSVVPCDLSPGVLA